MGSDNFRNRHEEEPSRIPRASNYFFFGSAVFASKFETSVSTISSSGDGPSRISAVPPDSLHIFTATGTNVPPENAVISPDCSERILTAETGTTGYGFGSDILTVAAEPRRSGASESAMRAE